MDHGTLIDAIVRQTTVLIAQLATAGGGRAQLSHTANQVFLDLAGALKEQGLGSKVIADMFGVSLRTYQLKVQRLSESSTERGRSLWEALFAYVQDHGANEPVSRSEILRHFSRDESVSVKGVLRDLVDSGLVYRTGRGDLTQYRLADPGTSSEANTTAERLEHVVWLAVHRLSPASKQDLTDALSLAPERLDVALERLVNDGRIQASKDVPGAFTSNGCVIPLNAAAGWEAAVFDHYQAMVAALCNKLQSGLRGAQAADLIGGSTFSYRVWPEHPYYEEATRFLTQFRANGAALRKKIAAYNDSHPEPEAGVKRVVVYAGQNVVGLEEGSEDE